MNKSEEWTLHVYAPMSDAPVRVTLKQLAEKMRGTNRGASAESDLRRAARAVVDGAVWDQGGEFYVVDESFFKDLAGVLEDSGK